MIRISRQSKQSRFTGLLPVDRLGYVRAPCPGRGSSLRSRPSGSGGCKRPVWVFVTVLLACLASPPVTAAERVARVIDGDTVLLEDGREVRYAGINAPEQGDPGYQESSQANNLLVGGKEIRLEFGPRRKEKHERLLAYVYVGRMLVQAELVKQGWAIVTRAQSLPRYLEALQKYQAEAREAGRGIWTKGEYRGKLVVVKVHLRESARSSPNDEYVVFKNVSPTPLVLTGWTITDEMNQSYLVPQFTVGPGKTFTLYTGSGKNTNDALYWGRRKTVWNKGGDTVIVKDSTGHFVVSHTY